MPTKYIAVEHGRDREDPYTVNLTAIVDRWLPEVKAGSAVFNGDHFSELKFIGGFIADRFMIRSIDGSGNSAVSSQLEFVANNFDLIEELHTSIEARKGRISSLFEANLHLDDAKDRLNTIRQTLKIFRTDPYHLARNMKIYYRSLLEEVEAKKDFTIKHEVLVSILASMQHEIQQCESVMQYMDCKGLAVIAGAILQKLGWEVSIFWVLDPRHPHLLLKKEDAFYEMHFNNGGLAFFIEGKKINHQNARCDPDANDVKRIDNDYLDKIRRRNPLGITRWPMPFDPETITLLDNIFIQSQQQT